MPKINHVYRNMHGTGGERERAQPEHRENRRKKSPEKNGCNPRSRASNTNVTVSVAGWHRRRQSPLLMAYSHGIVVVVAISRLALKQIFFQNKKPKKFWEKKERETAIEWVEESLIRRILWFSPFFPLANAPACAFPPGRRGNLLCDVCVVYLSISQLVNMRTHCIVAWIRMNRPEWSFVSEKWVSVCGRLAGWLWIERNQNLFCHRFVLHFLVFHRQPCVSGYSNPQHTHTHSTFFRLRAQIGPSITWHTTKHSIVDGYMDRRHKEFSSANGESIHICSGERRWEPRERERGKWWQSMCMIRLCAWHFWVKRVNASTSQSQIFPD